MVLQPSFIAQQNLMLGYDFTTEAESLNTREIQALACLDNPEGHGSPWWLDVQSYDMFLAGFTHVHRNENDVRRGLLQISVVNADTAFQSGTHWFVVAWLIE